ncbi:MAG TPA: GNAT family N-acetyltransferase [Rhodanobacteraceae bacterium]|jgi:ribosomal protein S18 acetylase RimI-like enzyme|nr:GNAT family N-acetyltransferase [Rhodanobacteraceae bacterium]
MIATDGTFTIAPAGPRDIPDIARLFRAYETHIGVDLSYQDFATEVSTLPGKYAPPRGQLLIAHDRNRSAIGCVALRPMDERGCCEMKRLFVAPEGRGFGLGRALAEAIIGEGTRLGYTEIRLDTLPSMLDAIGLYRKLGFSSIEPYYPAREGTIFMARRLDVA